MQFWGSIETSAHSGSSDAMVETGASRDDEESGVKRERKSDERPAWIVPAGGSTAFGSPMTKSCLPGSHAVEGLVPVVNTC